MIGSKDEAILRLATRWASGKKLSESAFQELLLDVKAQPEKFMSSPDDQGFIELDRMVEDYYSALDRDFESAEEYEEVYAQAQNKLHLCAERINRSCSLPEAALIEVLTSALDVDERITQLLALELKLDEEAASASTTEAHDLWDDVFSRGRLRVKAALCRIYLETSHITFAVQKANELLCLSPSDALGAHKTAALAYARLEDENGLNELESHFVVGDPWLHLARIILLYKLDRMNAATRALRGFDHLFYGGAYIFLNPHFVAPYLTCRPECEAGSLAELELAMSEAEPVIADVPDLPVWAQQQTWFVESAMRFASENGIEWEQDD